MSLVTFLRKNWLLILFIIIGLLWWPVYFLLRPSTPILGWDPSLTNIDYWSIATHVGETWWRVPQGIAAGFIVIWILAFIKMSRIPIIASRSIVIVASLLLCPVFTCSSWANWAANLKSGRSIEHIMSITYQNKIYHLALSTYAEPFAEEYSSYYVFECDTSGKICSKIEDVGLAWRPDTNGQLAISKNKLILDRKFEQIQILPDENKSS